MDSLTAKYWRGLMIISHMSEPQKSLYVIGANILTAFKKADKKLIEPLELYEVFKGFNQNISLSYFYFGLDWLFMIDAIELDEFGNIKLCN